MKDFTITNIGDTELSLPMPFIFIAAKGKTFEFQADDGSNISKIDETKEITFKNNFFICAYPITQEFWEAVVTESKTEELDQRPSNFRGKVRPLEQVSWYEIQVFNSILNTLLTNNKLVYSNRESIGGSFGIPSESQWEYAANANQDFVFSGSQNFNDVGWNIQNSNYHSMPVGLKVPNAWGLFDMSGNVWEGCANDFNIIESNGEIGPNHDMKLMPIRGGSYVTNVNLCSFRIRSNVQMNQRSSEIGFRLKFELGRADLLINLI